MICLKCCHYMNPDREMERVQGSTYCRCDCHPWVIVEIIDEPSLGDDGNEGGRCLGADERVRGRS